MKKLFMLCLAVMLLCATALAADEDWQFDADYYFMRGYYGTDEVVIMPSYMEYCPVEVLMDGILRDNQDIDTVLLSDCLLDLRKENFYNNGKLRRVDLPQTLIVIGDDNFVECPELAQITVPSQVSYIGARCFSACDKLLSVTFEGACPVFGPDCFENTAADLVIYVPDDQLDAYCAALPLQNVQPSGKLAQLHDFTSDENFYIIMDDWIYAYEGFETRVDVPPVIYNETMTAVGECAFPASAYITYITLPEGITSIGMQAFSSMEQLFHITLPSTLRVIDSMAFEYFQGYSITLPEGLTTIGPKAFRGSNLQGELVLPSTVTSVSADFLLDCYNLTKLVVMGNPLILPEELMIYSPNIEITVPDDATENQKKLLEAYLNGTPEMTVATELDDVFAYYGEEAAVTVIAVGDGLQYAWYARNAYENAFTPVEDVTGNCYSIIMDQAAQGRQIYCVVTDLYGNTVETSTATLSGGTALAIYAQPADATAEDGAWVQTTTEVIGDGLQYAWYVKAPWSDVFEQDAASTGDTYGLMMAEEASGTQAYCVVTDLYGSAVTTQVATLTMETVEIPEPEPEFEPEPEPMGEPVAVGAAGEPFLGTWHLQTLDMGGMVMNATDIGMQMVLTFHADGTVSMYDGETTETGMWTVTDGAASVMDMSLTITEDGSLCMAEDGAQLLFGRDGAAGAEMSEEELMLALLAMMAQTEIENTASDPTDILYKKYVAKQFSMSGMTMDASMLGSEYSLYFRDDGTCDLSMSGVELPNVPWNWTDDTALVIDYYGVEFPIVLTETGFDMDYYGTMTLHFEAAE